MSFKKKIIATNKICMVKISNGLEMGTETHPMHVKRTRKVGIVCCHDREARQGHSGVLNLGS